jgi:thiol-disulfide isomerase/thioredoxin
MCKRAPYRNMYTSIGLHARVQTLMMLRVGAHRWCGPCKVVAPKFEEMSTKYTDAIFAKCVGDSSPGLN